METRKRGWVLLTRRVIGISLYAMLFLLPLVEGGFGAVNFILALFTVMPLPLMTIPFLAITLYLSSGKKVRKADVVLILLAVLLLVTAATPFGMVALIFLPFILFATPFGLLAAITVAAAILLSFIMKRRKGKTMAAFAASEGHADMEKRRIAVKAPRALGGTFMRSCPYCGRDLSTLPKDIAICPYCGEKLAQLTCSACGRDLSQFPADIKSCPYCGKAVSIQVEVATVKVKPVEVELPAEIQRIRRYAKMTALFGVLIAASSFLMGPLLGGFMTGPEPNAPYMFPVLHENTSALWYGVYVGALLAIASAIVRVIAGAFKRKKR